MKDKYIIKQECECQYIKWFDITNDDSPTDKKGIEIHLKTWYPAFLVRWIVRYKIWRDR